MWKYGHMDTWAGLSSGGQIRSIKSVTNILSCRHDNPACSLVVPWRIWQITKVSYIGVYYCKITKRHYGLNYDSFHKLSSGLRTKPLTLSCFALNFTWDYLINHKSVVWKVSGAFAYLTLNFNRPLWPNLIRGSVTEVSTLHIQCFRADNDFQRFNKIVPISKLTFPGALQILENSSSPPLNLGANKQFPLPLKQKQISRFRDDLVPHPKAFIYWPKTPT